LQKNNKASTHCGTIDTIPYFWIQASKQKEFREWEISKKN